MVLIRCGASAGGTVSPRDTLKGADQGLLRERRACPPEACSGGEHFQRVTFWHRQAQAGALPAGTVTSVTRVAANLLQIAATRQVAHPYRGPAYVPHHLRKTSARAGAAAALGDLQDVKHRLRADALDAIVADFAAQALQAQQPGIARGAQFGPAPPSLQPMTPWCSPSTRD